MPPLQEFIHLMFVGFIALFPVVNPIGTAFIVLPYFAHLSDAERRRAVRKITVYAFCISTVALVAGRFIMSLFGISIPVVQMAGGIMICKIGWEFLASDKNEKSSDSSRSSTPTGYERVRDQLFYPITFPMTTGAGTISVLFTLSAHGTNDDIPSYLLNMGAVVVSIALMCVLIYFFYSNTERIVAYLGSEGEKITNRVIAFLIFCVGIQIATSGARAAFLDAPHPSEAVHPLSSLRAAPPSSPKSTQKP